MLHDHVMDSIRVLAHLRHGMDQKASGNTRASPVDPAYHQLMRLTIAIGRLCEIDVEATLETLLSCTCSSDLRDLGVHSSHCPVLNQGGQS